MTFSINPEIPVSKTVSLPCEKNTRLRLADLLISVRDQEELLEVRKSEAQIIDLKEPDDGPLAPADPALWQFAADLWQRSQTSTVTSLSAALGEQDQARNIASSLPPEFDFAKAGPSDCDSGSKLCRLWDEMRRLLPESTELVAVAYADWDTANCLAPNVIFQLASEQGFKRCLIDTYTKDGKSTLDHLGHQGLTELYHITRQQKMWWTLAGSIRKSMIDELQRFGWLPDCIGIRGDVCIGDRASSISAELIQGWCQRLTCM